MNFKWKLKVLALLGGVVVVSATALAQLVDKTKAPNAANSGINRSLSEEIGAGRGDIMTPGSSLFIINRDPFRAIRRGRQLFQRKFTRREGQGPGVGDGSGDINTNPAIGAGLGDSCANCHGRPKGGAGAGGDVATRPDSRDAPHLFGLGIKEMLADEITGDLRGIQTQAISQAKAGGHPVSLPLTSKGISFGTITANPDGSLDTSQVEGVNADLRVRPFFADGETISIREFVVGALQNEMGLQAVDPDTVRASQGARVVTPSGMVLDGTLDKIQSAPTDDPTADPDGDGVINEIPTSLVDYFEFYLLNYFKPAIYQQTDETNRGLKVFKSIGCTECHVPDLQINHDRRVADLDTAYDPVKGIFNSLFSTATPLVNTINDGTGLPALKQPKLQPFLVHNIFTDFKRHNLGPNFFENNYDGSTTEEFLTRPLWGVGSKGAFGHDGRSITLAEVILRHGGEAQAARDAFSNLGADKRREIIEFLRSLILFPPDDTASTLDPGNKSAPGFPQTGHGSIKLTVLFNDPTDVE
ncbi:MAG TPA: di-heme oxidoredictase family protein [Blastocatellia bacterium]|nr:di-heme oxidoredictase family protein [Blastocatellia bacterium]